MEIVEIEAIILILTTFQSLLPPQFVTSKLNGIIWLAIVLNGAGMAGQHSVCELIRYQTKKTSVQTVAIRPTGHSMVMQAFHFWLFFPVDRSAS